MQLVLEAVAVRPGALHPDSGERTSDKMEIVGTVTDETLHARVVRRRAGVLDVIHAETKLLQPGQIVDELPSNTRQRKLAEQPQHNDAVTNAHGYSTPASCNSLRKTLSAAKYSAAISRAASAWWT